MHFWTAPLTCCNLEIKSKNKDGQQLDASLASTQELLSLAQNKSKISSLKIYIFHNLFWNNPNKMNILRNLLMNKSCHICKAYFGIQLLHIKLHSIRICIIISLNKRIICLSKFYWGTLKNVVKLYFLTCLKSWRKRRDISTVKKSLQNLWEKCQIFILKTINTLVDKSLHLSIFTFSPI